MSDFNKALLYTSIACSMFFIYLVLSYFWPQMFDFVLVGIFHELLTLPVIFVSGMVFIYSSLMLLLQKNRMKILPVFIISFINACVLGVMFLYAD